MLKLEDLTNEKKRKEFYQNYQENFELVHHDEFNGFDYYRYTFENGSFLTALEYNHDLKKSGPYRAVITLTYAYDDYRPINSTQSEIIEHLRIMKLKMDKEKD